MAAQADFTDQEWQAMQKGVLGTGLLVSMSDRGFFDTFKEAGALAKHLSEARRENASPLVRELAESRGAPFGLTPSPQEVETETLDALRSSMATLRAKAPEEADDYRRFVLDVAESVAGAAGGGESVESEAIEKIRSALAGTSAA